MPLQLQIALISAVVSVLVVALKDLYDRRARRVEWQQNRDAWLLEKEAKDVEEIITAINGFVARRAEIGRNIYNDLLNVDLDYRRDITLEEAYEIADIESRAVSDAYDTLADYYNDVSRWFYFKPQTLTVWLRDAAAVEELVKGLADDLLAEANGNELVTMIRTQATVEHYRTTSKENLAAVRRMEEQTDKALARIAAVQRNLTKRLRDTSKVA